MPTRNTPSKSKKTPPASDLPERSNKLRINGKVARDLGIRIVSGRHQPGYLLNTEIAASDELHVSRSAYREAIKILNSKGLVHSRPKIGTQVGTRKDWNLLDPDVLSWIFDSDPDEKLLADLFELRKIIEPAATIS